MVRREDKQAPATIFSKVDAWVSRLNPWFGVAGLAVAAVSLILYFFDRPIGEIAYYDETVTVYDAAKADNKLRIIDQNGAPIDESVHALKVILVNIGSLAAESSLVRSPLTVSLAGASRIISTRVQDQSYPGTTKAHTELTAPGSSDVSITWSHFDPGDRIEVLVLYEATGVVSPELAARVHGFSLTKADRLKSGPSYGRFILAAIAALMAAFFWLLVIAGIREIRARLSGGSYVHAIKLAVAIVFFAFFASLATGFAYYQFTRPVILVAE